MEGVRTMLPSPCSTAGRSCREGFGVGGVSCVDWWVLGTRWRDTYVAVFNKAVDSNVCMTRQIKQNEATRENFATCIFLAVIFPSLLWSRPTESMLVLRHVGPAMGPGSAPLKTTKIQPRDG